MRKLILAIALLACVGAIVRADDLYPRPSGEEAFSSEKVAPGILPNALPYAMLISFYPAINSFILGGTYEYMQDGPDDPSSPRRRFGPGSLIVADIIVTDSGGGGVAVTGGQLTSTYADYSATTWPQSTPDGFRIRPANCGIDAYIKKIERPYLPNGTLSNATQRVTFYWPGNYGPEYSGSCSGLLSYGSTDFTFYKGSGAFPTSGLSASYVKSVLTAPGFPVDYVTDNADAGDYINAGYFHNNVTGAEYTFADCNTTPTHCPRYTTVAGSPVYHTMVVYTMGLGDGLPGSLNYHSTPRMVEVGGSTYYSPTRTSFTSYSFLVEQHNLSTQGLPAAKFKLNWTCNTGLTGCTPSGAPPGASNGWNTAFNRIRLGTEN